MIYRAIAYITILLVAGALLWNETAHVEKLGLLCMILGMGLGVLLCVRWGDAD